MSSVIDFRSPIPSPLHKSPIPRNPSSDSHFSLCFDFSSVVSHGTETMTSSSTVKTPAAESVFTPPAPQEKFNLSGMSGRPRPRLLKTRRQVGSSQPGTLGSAFNKSDPGFNPFRPVSDSDANSSVSNNSYSNSKGDIKSEKFEDVRFVFGAYRSDSDHSAVKLGCQKGEEPCESKSNWDSSVIGIGAKKADIEMNGNSGRREFSENVSNSGPVNRPKINVGREFGETIGISDRVKSKIQSNTEFRNFDMMGPIYSADKDPSASNFNFEKQDSSQNVGNSVSYDNVGFMSGYNQRSLVGSLIMEEKKTHRNREQLVYDDGTQVKREINVLNGKSDRMGFVFGAGQSNLQSNSKLEKENSNKLFGKPISDDVGVDLKLGPDQRVSMSNLNREKVECCKQTGSLTSDVKEKILNGVFKSNAKTSALGSDKNDKHTSVVSFGIDGGSHSSSEATACGTSSLFRLSDDIKKLSINTPFSVGGADKSKSFNFGSFSKSDDIFVFGSKGASSMRSSITPCSQIKNSNIGVFGNGPSVEGISEQKIKKSDGNMVPSDTRNDSGNNNAQTNLGCSFETLVKEGQSINLKDNISNSPLPECIPTVFTFQAGLDKSFVAAHCPRGQENDDPKSKEADRPSSLSSVCPDTLPNFSGFEASWTSGFDRKSRLEKPVMNFHIPKQEAPISFTSKFCAGLDEKLKSNAKSKSMKDRRLKKDRGKMKQPSNVKLYPEKDSIPGESSSQEGLDFAGCYSPMDFSPYRETFPTTREPFNLDNNCVSTAEHSEFSADARDEDPLAKRGNVPINSDTQKGKEPNEEEGHSCNFDTETSCHVSRTAQVCFSSSVSVGSDAKTQESTPVRQFFSASSSEDLSGKHFTFSASSPVQSHPSSVKHRFRKNRNSLKGNPTIISSSSGVTLTSSSLQFAVLGSNSLPLGGVEGQSGDSPRKGETKSEEVTGQVKQGFNSSASATMEELCEKWRLRGNQAYKDGRFSRAEDCYTKGINVVPSGVDTSSPLCEPLVLCYSNRAATRMSLGRMREALGDCKMVVALDQNFLKARIRSANCHLMLGELDEALDCFNKCVESGSDVCLDRRIVMDAFDGIQKAKKVDEYTKQSAELLQKSASGAAAATALDMIVKALSLSSYSERLLEMKAEALCMLQKYEEVIHLCNQTSNFAEKNFASLDIDTSSPSIEFSECNSSTSSNLWRLRMISKSYFRMGKLEMALDVLEKQERARSVLDKTPDSSAQLVVTIRELLQHKKKGNEAFQAGKYAAAVEHYTAALSMNIESRPFAAICFCNRAAAHQALGQFADAIADCSLAIALNEAYLKAISRRATLHEKIRDHGQAASDLARLISVVENQLPESPRGSSSSNKEIRNAHSRLSVVEEEAKKGISLDLYLILGIKATDTDSEIKKAYRKAALKHHPDKAAQFLTRSAGGDHGLLRKEVLEVVHRDADRLFKMIGEAYAVLSDPTKRSRYDREEKNRNIPRESSGSSSFTQSSSDYYSYPHERNTSKGYSRGTYKTYGNSYSRW